MKKTAKFICVVLVLAIIVVCLPTLVFATEITPNIIAHYTFDEGVEGWTLFSGSWGEELALGEGDEGGERINVLK